MGLARPDSTSFCQGARALSSGLKDYFATITTYLVPHHSEDRERAKTRNPGFVRNRLYGRHPNNQEALGYVLFTG